MLLEAFILSFPGFSWLVSVFGVESGILLGIHVNEAWMSLSIRWSRFQVQNSQKPPAAFFQFFQLSLLHFQWRKDTPCSKECSKSVISDWAIAGGTSFDLWRSELGCCDETCLDIGFRNYGKGCFTAIVILFCGQFPFHFDAIINDIAFPPWVNNIAIWWWD